MLAASLCRDLVCESYRYRLKAQFTPCSADSLIACPFFSQGFSCYAMGLTNAPVFRAVAGLVLEFWLQLRNFF
jgi:hypothetical protein